MRFGPETPSSGTISLAPLIDVVFILLVFFMLASSFLDWRAVDLKLSGRAETATAAGESLVVDVEQGGRLRLDGAETRPDQLGAEIARRLAAQPDLAVILRPAATVSLQSTVDVLDLLKRAGVSDLTLARTP